VVAWVYPLRFMRELCCHILPGQSVCESLAKLGLQPCWAQEFDADASVPFKPKPANVGYEPMLSAFNLDQVRRLHVTEVFERAAERFNVWLQRYMQDFSLDQLIPPALFNSTWVSTSSFGLQGGPIFRARFKATLERAIADTMPKVALDVIEAVQNGLAQQCASDSEGDVQLTRFEAITCALIDCAKFCLTDFSFKFRDDAMRRIRSLFDWASGCDDLGNIWGTGVSMHAAVCASVKECIIQASVSRDLLVYTHSCSLP
jgi:hypothetical protein